MENLIAQEKMKTKLVAMLKELITNAENLLPEERCKTGDYKNNPNVRYPQTESERIVVKALDLLLDQEWVDDDPLLSEILDVLGQLDTGVNKPWAWQELFKLKGELP